jgi:hypothetical protein
LYEEGTYFEVQSSISDAFDVDFYRIRSPNELPALSSSLILVLDSITRDRPLEADLQVLNNQSVPISHQMLILDDGRLALQVNDVEANTDYFVEIGPRPNSTASTGNYQLSATFGPRNADFRVKATGQFASGSPLTITHALELRLPTLVTMAIQGRSSHLPNRQFQVEVVGASDIVQQQFLVDTREFGSSYGVLLLKGSYRIRVHLLGDPPISDIVEYDLLTAEQVNPLAIPLKVNPITPKTKVVPIVDVVIAFPLRPSPGNAHLGPVVPITDVEPNLVPHGRSAFLVRDPQAICRMVGRSHPSGHQDNSDVAGLTERSRGGHLA